MDINKYIEKISKIELDKKYRVFVMLVYALLMFVSILNEMNLITFILLFAVVPIGVYFYVKKIFPKGD